MTNAYYDKQREWDEDDKEYWALPPEEQEKYAQACGWTKDEWEAQLVQSHREHNEMYDRIERDEQKETLKQERKQERKEKRNQRLNELKQTAGKVRESETVSVLSVIFKVIALPFIAACLFPILPFLLWTWMKGTPEERKAWWDNFWGS